MPGACRCDRSLSQGRPALHAPATCPSHGCIPSSPATVEACNGTRAGHGSGKVKHCEYKRPVSAVPQGTDNQDSGKRQQGQQNRDWKETLRAFDSTGKPSLYTEIRCVLQPSESPQSRFFMAAVFSADYDDALTLLIASWPWR